jgi:hypothetical protein
VYCSFSSDFVNNIEHSNDTITSTASEHISLITEINCESSSTKIFDLGTWFEHVVSIKNFNFVRSTTTSDNEISSVLLELSAVNLASFF